MFNILIITIGLISLVLTFGQEACGHREGDKYIICESQKTDFLTKGLAILPDILTEEELLPIEILYNKYMSEGSSEIQGKDFCDMSKAFDTKREDYSVVNAMLPHRYYPEFQNNTYERVARSIAKQLFPDVDMEFDYDQLLDKTPKAADAIFAWHQDMAYWPTTAMTPDTRTITFSLAFDTTTIENGCIRYIPYSGLSKTLRVHNSIAKDRNEGHAIGIDVDEQTENIEYAKVPRLSASIHDEWVVHGSSGNNSPNSRRTYVMAFRTLATVKTERAAGFTHSHNDKVNWDSFNNWQSEKESKEL